MTNKSTRFGTNSPTVDLATLKHVPLFRDLHSAELEAMRSSFEMQTVRPGTDLIQFSQLNDKVFFLLSGTIRIYIRKGEKSEVVLAILGPGEVFGEISVLDGLPASVSVMTVEECRFVTMRAHDFVRALKRNATLALNLVSVQNRRMRRLTTHWQALATLNVSARLAHQLLLFADDYGVPKLEWELPRAAANLRGRQSKSLSANSAASPTARFRPMRSGDAKQPILIWIRLTQADLAALCGSSLRQINRVMLEYQKEGLVEIGGGCRITLLDTDALKLKCG